MAMYDVQLVDITGGRRHEKRTLDIDPRDGEQLRSVLRNLAVTLDGCNEYRPEQWAARYELLVFWRGSEQGPGQQNGPMRFSGVA